MNKQQINGWLILLLYLLSPGFFGCNGAQPQSSEAQAAGALSLDCHVAYRSSVSVGIEREETISFAAADDNQTISFPDLEFHTQYWAGLEQWEERGLKVSVRV